MWISRRMSLEAAAGEVLLRPMQVGTSSPLRARPLALPNLLTYGRIAAVPAVVACMYWNMLQPENWLRWTALVIFIGAGVTDMAYSKARA